MNYIKILQIHTFSDIFFAFLLRYDSYIPFQQTRFIIKQYTFYEEGTVITRHHEKIIIISATTIVIGITSFAYFGSKTPLHNEAKAVESQKHNNHKRRDSCFSKS